MGFVTMFFGLSGFVVSAGSLHQCLCAADMRSSFITKSLQVDLEYDNSKPLFDTWSV